MSQLKHTYFLFYKNQRNVLHLSKYSPNTLRQIRAVRNRFNFLIDVFRLGQSSFLVLRTRSLLPPISLRVRDVLLFYCPV